MTCEGSVGTGITGSAGLRVCDLAQPHVDKTEGECQVRG